MWLAAAVVMVAKFHPFVLSLGEVHSGHVGDYVAWLTFGLAALGGAFAFVLR